MNTKDIFSQRLNEAIKASCTNNAALARRTGASACSVYGWRRGRNMPDGYNIAAICRALGVSADWLLGLDNEGECEQ